MLFQEGWIGVAEVTLLQVFFYGSTGKFLIILFFCPVSVRKIHGIQWLHIRPPWIYHR